MRRAERLRFSLAGALWALGALLPLITVAWALAVPPDVPAPREGVVGPHPLGPYLLLHVVLFIPAAYVGASLAARPSPLPLAWVLLIIAAANGVGWFASLWSVQALLADRLPLGELTVVMTHGERLAQILAGCLGVALVATGRLPTGAARFVVIPALLVGAGRLIGGALAPGPLVTFGLIDNPVGVPGTAGEIAQAVNEPALWPLAITPIALWLFHVARGDDLAGRRRVLRRVGAMLLLITWGWLALRLADLESWGWVLTAAYVVVLADVLVIAARRERLWGMTTLMHRTALWIMLGAVASALHVVVALGLTSVGLASGSVAVVLAAAVGLGSASAVYASLDPWLRRRLVGDGDDPARAFERLGSRLDVSATPAAVPPLVADAVEAAVRGGRVTIDLLVGGERRRVAGRTPSDGPRIALPLAYDGQALGVLTLSVPPGEALGAPERRLVQVIADRAAPALEAARLALELEQEGSRGALADVAAAIDLRVGVPLRHLAGELRGLDALDRATAMRRLAAVDAGFGELVLEVRACAREVGPEPGAVTTAAVTPRPASLRPVPS